MPLPQAFQYQGSKRALAPQILGFLPARFDRLIEPFAGSAAMSIACAARGITGRFWINDRNAPLADLLKEIISRPHSLADLYQELWTRDEKTALETFHAARSEFNQTHSPHLLLYLLARCIKGAVRYNNHGAFNQSADNRRLGTRPATMRKNLAAVSALLHERTQVTSLDFREVLDRAQPADVIYMDPPYQGTSLPRDSRYLAGLTLEDFATALDHANTKGLRYAVSYDGRTGGKHHGLPLPSDLGLTRMEIIAGRSSQATLHGRNEITVESLYLSPVLVRTVHVAS